jgi:hypothetical protein
MAARVALAEVVDTVMVVLADLVAPLALVVLVAMEV